ncbi:Nitrilotriacetate monooxygenase component A [Rhodococcus sp. YH1]|nr:Nitrilotriacetate monooxygenase component A [Rhodococcus sp. YH1]
MTAQMHLAAFVTAGPGRPGGWRHPGSVPGWLDADYYQNIARTLERGRFDLAFFPDILSVPDRFGGSTDSQLRYGALGSLRMDPLPIIASMAAATRHLGLAATVSTTYAQPFNLARTFATLDHLTSGRVAWNIVTSFQESEARNFDLDEQFDRATRYERADEFLQVTGKLWDSWDDDALVLDPDEPLFAEPAKVHRIDHQGRFFSVQGPLNVPRPPQGYPVLIQAGASAKGKDFAARWSDVIFCSHASKESAQAFYTEIKERAAKYGRDPESVKILPSITPVVGPTSARAKELAEEMFELVPPIGGLSTLAYHLDVDLSTFPLDERLPEVEVPGVEGHYNEVREITEREGLTLRQLGKQYGGRYEGGFIGTAAEVADGLQEWFEDGAADGFTLQAPHQPGGFETFAREVVPQLQRRGILRTEYTGATLRENLGLSRPGHGEWAERAGVRL